MKHRLLVVGPLLAATIGCGLAGSSRARFTEKEQGILERLSPLGEDRSSGNTESDPESIGSTTAPTPNH